MTQLLRVQNFFLSKDGFGAGVGQSLEQPFGHAAPQGDNTPNLPYDLGSWAFATASWVGRTDGGGSRGLDDYFIRDYPRNIGAEIMGRRKFGPQNGPWPDDGWRGWWGEEPPFKTPCFILTHHPREPMVFANGTSFHFIDADPAEALRRANEAADGKDVRIGGGPSTIRQFLRDDLVDFMHVVVVPITLGRGVRLWDDVVGIEDRFTIESVSSSSGLTHQLWNRKR